MDDLVPDENICQWLQATRWKGRNSFVWRKYSLNENMLLLPNDEGADIKLAPLSGREEYSYPAPTVREILDEIPSDVTISRHGQDWYVSTPIAPNQNVFQLKPTLEEALARLWIALQHIDELK